MATVSVHPDFDHERRYLEHAHDCLDRMRNRSESALATLDVPKPDADTAVAQSYLRRRLFSLNEELAALCFGRIDEENDGDTFYIGRRHVEDDAGDPVVVDWRAGVSSPFYRATASNPMELHRRRRFSADGRDLIDLLDEIFDDPDHPELAMAGGVPDPLLAELERARAGEMRDIVATIQGEQDVVIRAPLEEAVIVQGGPGTGKTAVGLHRAAFLLYEHRALLEDRRVLVVGPNKVFLRYIGAVLPSLGETAVVQNTVEGLAGGVRHRVRATESDAIAELKGDARMAQVLAELLRGQVSWCTDEVQIRSGFGTFRLDSTEINDIAASTLDTVSTFSAARDVARRKVQAVLFRRVFDRLGSEVPAESEFLADLRSSKDFTTLLGRLFPSVSAPQLVRRLLSNKRARSTAADAILSPDEVALLQRSIAKKVADEPWTAADLPLLDEAEALINGPARTYGHVVVDEAQELSAMALRLIARRAHGGSMTVLGDLGQATSPGSQTSWETVSGHLGLPTTSEVAVLEIGYRLPSTVLDLASALLPEAAPGIAPSRSVRPGGSPPEIRAIDDESLIQTVVDVTTDLTESWGLLGVIAPRSMVGDVVEALGRSGLDVGTAERGGLERTVTVLDAAEAKGLEFDAVLVVEPGLIVSEELHGMRALYVALTRCVQHLVLVHAQPLPAALAAQIG